MEKQQLSVCECVGDLDEASVAAHLSLAEPARRGSERVRASSRMSSHHRLPWKNKKKELSLVLGGSNLINGK